MAVDCIGFGNQLLSCGAATLARRKPCEAWSLSRAPMMVFLGIFRDVQGRDRESSRCRGVYRG